MNLPSGRLPGYGVLRFSGADALPFLQGQISNDSRRLGEGQALLAACSTPQGRVFAILRLLPHSSGVLALLPRERVADVGGRLRKYVLRSKVRVEDAGDALAVAGYHGAQALAAAGLALPDAAATAYRETDGIGVAAVAAAAAGVATAGVAAGAAPRYWVVGPAAALAARGLLGPESDAGGVERGWRLADIAAGLPQVYADTAEAFVAQMLNLDLLDGISFTKGCFTGQEIIARTQHLGRIKRRMARVRLPDGPWRIGGPVRLTDGRSGRITELVECDGGFDALAVLPLAGAAAESEAERADPAAPVAATAAQAAAGAGVEVQLPYPLTVPS
jgi:folate-binding protein YgfZ